MYYSQCLLIFLCGVVSFSLIYIVLVNFLQRCLCLNSFKTHTIAMRLVSALQGAMATAIGVIIICTTQDYIYERHWLAEPYIMIATGYLIYDTGATFICFQKQLQYEYTVSKTIIKFVKNDPAMIFHHIGLPLFFVPVILCFRRGLGDGFIGCFMLIEAIVPFVSCREILILVGKKSSMWYALNGFLLVIVYTLCRILLFPFMLWLHGNTIGVAWWQVPSYIPSICSIGCCIFLMLYLYWYKMIFQIAWSEVGEKLIRDKTRKDI